MNLEFSGQIFEKYSNTLFYFIKLRLVGARLSDADESTGEQTDIINLRVAFRNFANAPKIWTSYGGSTGREYHWTLCRGQSISHSLLGALTTVL